MTLCGNWKAKKATPAVYCHITHRVACFHEYTLCVSPSHNFDTWVIVRRGTRLSYLSNLGMCCLWLKQTKKKNILACKAFELTSSKFHGSEIKTIPCTYSKLNQQQSCPCPSLSCSSILYVLTSVVHPFNKISGDLQSSLNFKRNVTISVGIKKNFPYVCLSQLEQ